MFVVTFYKIWDIDLMVAFFVLAVILKRFRYISYGGVLVFAVSLDKCWNIDVMVASLYLLCHFADVWI